MLDAKELEVGEVNGWKGGVSCEGPDKASSLELWSQVLGRDDGDSNEVGGSDVDSCKRGAAGVVDLEVEGGDSDSCTSAADLDVEGSDVDSCAAGTADWDVGGSENDVGASDGWSGWESRADKISADAVI